VLAGGRAILMELAHPSIAQAVAAFDHFREDPARRAQLTAMAFRDVIHGSEVEAAAVGRRLTAVHSRVRGAGYAATDPALVLWVHATFIDSLLCIGQHLYGALSGEELDDFYRDAVVVGEVFGCPAADQPATLDEFRTYVAHVVESLDVSDIGRELARAVFWPTVPANRGTIIHLYRVASYGSLPPRLRDQLGYPWERSQRRWFSTGSILGRLVAPVTDRAMYAVADGNGRGISAALALAGLRTSGR
jgi:uncharacterized protein (DUF2236 family)